MKMDKYDVFVAVALAACTFISGLMEPPKDDTRNVSELQKRFDTFLCMGITCTIMFVFIVYVMPLAIEALG